MHFTCCGMPKGTSWAEATLNSEKIQPVAVVIIKLLSEGIRNYLLIHKKHTQNVNKSNVFLHNWVEGPVAEDSLSIISPKT